MTLEVIWPLKCISVSIMRLPTLTHWAFNPDVRDEEKQKQIKAVMIRIWLPEHPDRGCTAPLSRHLVRVSGRLPGGDASRRYLKSDDCLGSERAARAHRRRGRTVWSRPSRGSLTLMGPRGDLKFFTLRMTDGCSFSAVTFAEQMHFGLGKEETNEARAKFVEQAQK